MGMPVGRTTHSILRMQRAIIRFQFPTVQTIAIAILLILSLESCKRQNDEKQITNYNVQGDEFTIPDSSNIKANIKIGHATKEGYSYQFYSAAKVTAIPNKYADIAAPFNGRIMQSFIVLGQRVEQGTPLFSISSSEFNDAQKLFLQAKQQYLLAEKDYQRQQDLLKNGVGAQKDLETSKTNLEVTRSEYEKSQLSIRIFGIKPEKMIFGEPLIVRSPIKGRVIANGIVVGKYLTDNSNAILTVAELSPIWIAATVKEKDIRYVREGDSTDAEVTAYPGEVFHGNVYHVADKVDEETRSINVLIECPNKDERLKYGMYATVKFTIQPVQAVFVPATALLQFNDKNFVFIQITASTFKRQFVTTAETVNGKTVITVGLTGNETLITEGGFYLMGTE